MIISYIYFASTVLCTQKVVCSKNLFSGVVFHELFKNQLQIEKSDVDLDQKLGFRASIDRFPGDLRFSTSDSRYGTAIGRETAGNDVLDSLRSSSVKFSVRGHPKTQLDAVCSMMVSQKTAGIASSLCSNGRVGLREYREEMCSWLQELSQVVYAQNTPIIIATRSNIYVW